MAEAGEGAGAKRTSRSSLIRGLGQRRLHVGETIAAAWRTAPKTRHEARGILTLEGSRFEVQAMRLSLAVLSLLTAVGAPVAAYAADYPDHPVYRAESSYERTDRIYDEEPEVEERVVRRPPPVVERRVYVEEEPVVDVRPRVRPYGFYGPGYVRGPGFYGPRWRGPGWRGPRAHWVHRRW